MGHQLDSRVPTSLPSLERCHLLYPPILAANSHTLQPKVARAVLDAMRQRAGYNRCLATYLAARDICDSLPFCFIHRSDLHLFRSPCYGFAGRATASSLEHGGAICCPSLSEIGTEDQDHPDRDSDVEFLASPGLFDTVRAALRTRADGGARLKKLEMHLSFTVELWRGSSGLRDAFAEDVGALVEELDCQYFIPYDC